MKKLVLLICFFCSISLLFVFYIFNLPITICIASALILLGTLGYLEKILKINWSTKSRITFFVMFLVASVFSIYLAIDKDNKITSLEKALDDTQTEVKGTKKDIVQAKRDFQDAQDELAVKVAIEKKRGHIERLEKEATIEGNAKALKELEKYVEIPAVKEFALSAIMRVKQYYYYLPFLRGNKMIIYDTAVGGTGKSNSEIPTYNLIKMMNWLGFQWEVRGQIAALLGKRKEKGVPEVLLEAMQDSRLDVSVIALKSFKAVTGYTGYKSKYGGKITSKDIQKRSGDITKGIVEGIFGFDQAKEWWSVNKAEVDKGLKVQDVK